MKTFKAIGVLTVLTGFFVGLAPQPGTCQMSRKSVVSCAMPCCNGAAKTAPSCPMIRSVAPHDSIAVSSYKGEQALTVVAALAFRDFVVPHHSVAVLYLQPQIPKAQFYSTPQVGPAPPVLA